MLGGGMIKRCGGCKEVGCLRGVVDVRRWDD